MQQSTLQPDSSEREEEIRRQIDPYDIFASNKANESIVTIPQNDEELVDDDNIDGFYPIIRVETMNEIHEANSRFVRFDSGEARKEKNEADFSKVGMSLIRCTEGVISNRPVRVCGCFSSKRR